MTKEAKIIRMFGILTIKFVCDEKESVHKKLPIANKIGPK